MKRCTGIKFVRPWGYLRCERKRPHRIHIAHVNEEFRYEWVQKGTQIVDDLG